MKLSLKDPPRSFSGGGVSITDFGKIRLDTGEMITLVSKRGRECDVTATEWGFYLAPSLNARLRNQGFKAALVMNADKKLFINAVEIDKIDLFTAYLESQKNTILLWLDEWND